MSLGGLRQTLNEDLLRFLWRQWSQLGVAGNVEFPDSWIIDPEALLMFTMKAGRYDPRLFDEVIDWTVRNGRWVSLQRLKNISKSADEESLRSLAAFAATVDSHDTRHRWRSLAQIKPPVECEQAPFFLETDETPLPLTGELDEDFLSRGLERPKVTLRHLSIPVPTGPPTNLLFKLRSLFGLAPRVEVAAYLMTNDRGKASIVARFTAYSHPPVSEALAELARSRFVYAEERGFYSMDAERWQRFLEAPSPLPVWVDWPRVFLALSRLASFLAEASDRSMSDYLLRSRAVTYNDALRDDLSGTGIPNPFLGAMDIDNAIETLIGRITEFLAAINTRSSWGNT